MKSPRVTLQPVTKDNWKEVVQLKTTEDQATFVYSTALSLAKVTIKPDGENVTYLPFAIYDHDVMVGFVMHAYEADTANMYWVDGFIIDQKYQGRGYGKAALTEIVSYIMSQFDQCEEIQLVVKPNNAIAIKLYTDFGFEQTGETYDDEGDRYRYKVNRPSRNR
ncbi:GNAT family N-acetyltransferase [Marininema halotolerans]|uniref:Diamine N-acetyltransferase n=1 Tax=Marininema halotolerans TaxID=1155944 RepID=A0A1I6THR1_9BACL|nr:GNAT family N-acetyltransferase [Marininema halotolerans]SFS88792.1 diamine N-acetyltransferase [Marininema halotolerans]